MFLGWCGQVHYFSWHDKSAPKFERGKKKINSPPLTVSGKGEEQRAAASLACLLCIQLGSGIESEEVFKTLKPIFKNILADGSANIQARQAVSVWYHQW